MRPIRFKINLLVTATVTVSLFFMAQMTFHYRALQNSYEELRQSLVIQQAVLHLPGHGYRAKTLQYLQSLRGALEPGARHEALSDVIQSYSAGDPKNLKRRIRTLLALERKESEHLQEETSGTFERTRAFAGLAFLSLLTGLFAVARAVHSNILKALNRLSNRMMDFLVDQYSFHFTEPSGNEIGDLQRTFNSLAQKVINGMDELRRLDQAKSDFLNIVSHEMRTPMTSIKGSLGLMANGLGGQLTPEGRQLLKIAETETDRLIRLINNLLDLAKIESGRLPLTCGWAEWDATVHKTSNGLLGLAHEAQVRIEIEPAPWLVVYMDTDRIQQILTNLLSNAIKFSPAGHAVRVSVVAYLHQPLVVRVKDQGRGISRADQNVIFQKFRQISSQQSPLVKGTGLGLAIAKALVEEHGGTIGVESEPGQGSTFWFTLPKWRDERVTSLEDHAA